MLDLVNDLLAVVASSSDVEVAVLAEALELLTSDEVLAALSHRLSIGLVGFSTLLSLSLDTLPRLSLRGRSVGPIFKADLRKSLLVHLKLPVDEDTVLAGDSDLGACGGSDLAVDVSGVFDLVDEPDDLVGVFDLDFSGLSAVDDLIDGLRVSCTALGGVFSLGLAHIFGSGSGSLLVGLTFDPVEVVPLEGLLLLLYLLT